MIDHICRIAMRHPLWAQIDRYNAMGSRFRSDSSRDGTTIIVWIIVAGIVIAVVAAFAAARMRQREGTPFRNPRRLFRDLCRLHDLDRTQRRLLKRLAELRGVKDPAELFIEPSYFSELEGNAKLNAQRDQLERLRQRLFAGDTTG